MTNLKRTGTLLGPVFVLVVTVGCSVQTLRAEDCPQGSSREQLECLSQAIDGEQKTLDALYNAALAALPDEHPSDVRKAQSQLVKAEAAWNAYVRENCAYIGGAEGGSDSWVTDFMARCQLDETRRRIEFFRHPPSAGN